MKLEQDRKQLFADRLSQACVAKWGREYGSASRLAEMMNVSVATAARWMRGTVTPEVERWGELAAKLDVSVQWLTGTTHEMPSALDGMVDERSLGIAKTVASMIVPMARRLDTDVTDDQLQSLVTRAFRQLEAGESKAAVKGMIYDALETGDLTETD